MSVLLPRWCRNEDFSDYNVLKRIFTIRSKLIGDSTPRKLISPSIPGLWRLCTT